MVGTGIGAICNNFCGFHLLTQPMNISPNMALANMNYKYHYLYCSLHFTLRTGVPAVSQFLSALATQTSKNDYFQERSIKWRIRLPKCSRTRTCVFGEKIVEKQKIFVRATPLRQAGLPVLHMARREEFANQDLIQCLSDGKWGVGQIGTFLYLNT